MWHSPNWNNRSQIWTSSFCIYTPVRVNLSVMAAEVTRMKRMQQLAVRMLVTSGLMAFPLAAVAEEVTCKTAGTIIVGITRSLVQDAVHFWGRDNAALQAMMDRGHVLFVKEGAELAVTIDEFDPGNPYKQVRRPGTPDRFWAFGTRQDYGCEKPQPVEPSPPTTAPAKPSPPKPAPKQTKPKGFPPPDTPTQPV